MTLITIVLPIFAIIFAGFYLRKINLVKIHWIHTLNTFVYYVSLPAIILASFWDINWYNAEIWKLVGVNLLSLIIFSVILLGLLSLIKISAKLKASIFLSVLAGNTIYMGFPIVGAAFSSREFSSVIAAATAHLVFGTIFGILIVEWLVARKRTFYAYWKDILTNPLVVSLVLGILFSLLNFNQPIFNLVKKPLAMLAATASPVALFALGAFLHGKFKPKHLEFTLAAAVLKLVGLPLFVLILAKLFNFSYSEQSISMLVAAMPTAVTCFIVSEQYGLEEEFVANTIVLGTLLSLLTISGFLLLS